MNIFVLSTGRCGSMTFARACSHLTNYTAGHETRAHLLPPERLAYPDNHIESDPRLAWFLGALGEKYDGKPVLYVHLTRDPAETARSLVRHALPTAEKPVSYPANMLRAFGHGIVMRPNVWEDYEAVARAYVDTVNGNIREFLSHRGILRRCHVEIGNDGQFADFLARIVAKGKRAAMAEWKVRHNASG